MTRCCKASVSAEQEPVSPLLRKRAVADGVHTE